MTNDHRLDQIKRKGSEQNDDSSTRCERTSSPVLSLSANPSAGVSQMECSSAGRYCSDHPVSRCARCSFNWCLIHEGMHIVWCAPPPDPDPSPEPVTLDVIYDSMAESVKPDGSFEARYPEFMNRGK
jgi:hypothetical protein